MSSKKKKPDLAAKLKQALDDAQALRLKIEDLITRNEHLVGSTDTLNQELRELRGKIDLTARENERLIAAKNDDWDTIHNWAAKYGALEQVNSELKAKLAAQTVEKERIEAWERAKREESDVAKYASREVARLLADKTREKIALMGFIETLRQVANPNEVKRDELLTATINGLIRMVM